MYAITYSFDESALKKNFNGSLEEAEQTIVDFFRKQGFEIHNSNLFVTNNVVDCVLITQILNRTFNWFRNCVLKIDLLRIEDCDSLLPVILPNRIL